MIFKLNIGSEIGKYFANKRRIQKDLKKKKNLEIPGKIIGISNIDTENWKHLVPSE